VWCCSFGCFFAGVCFGMSLEESVQIYFAFLQECTSFEATKNTHQNKNDDPMRVAKKIMYQTPMYCFSFRGPSPTFCYSLVN